ncbi:hypothetical protein L484_002900 [Morus notabilis]|uniref:Uncharacterized protein n=1 Tax=Morus notabilis TaxID=981085 RepID=W9QIL6_9ROSA|nr:uncharacterized protein LOC21386454 isoform X2 [Morus notabilis]EXB22546.1 hypothetical protein L484_002900 [Morus notabilis]
MIEKASKKQKKGSVSEEDVVSLLQRYTATTVLTLLNEVANCTDVKIDWNVLVEKSSTGISNASEYQMLWRHLAYRHSFLEKFEDGAQPLDDDSDLEYELEASPVVNNETSNEAAACVKVLIASGLPSDTNPSGSTIEAPLTINIPNGQPSGALEQPSCSTQGTNIIVPVSVQKQPAPAVTVVEPLDTNGSASGNLLKRKRKPWSEAEDLELIAAVQKCGEGNWANILRGDFKGDRTASQLSQRWAIIRKRHGNLNLGSSSNGTQLSEAQLAARHAMSLALNMPVKNLTANTISHAGTTALNNSMGTNSTNKSAGTNAAAGGNSSLQLQNQSQENLASKESPVGSLGPITKARIPMKKPLVKSTPSSDAMVRATAVAAGARIASPSDAASLLKAAQAKNAIHIRPTGSGSIKSSMPGGLPAPSEAHPNVHYIRTGLASAPVSNYAAATPSVPCPASVKSISSPVQQTPTSNGTSLDVSSKQKNYVSCTPAHELPLKQEAKTVEEIKVPASGSAAKQQIQGDGACVSANSQDGLVQDNKVAAPDPDAELKGTSDVGKPVSTLNERTAENDRLIVDIKFKDRESEKGNEIISSLVGAGENSEHQNIYKMQEDHAVGENVEPQNIDKMQDLAVGENGEPHKIDKMQEDHAVGIISSLVGAGENSEHQNIDKMQEDHAVGENGEPRNIDKMQEDLAVGENGEPHKIDKMQEDHAVGKNGEAPNTDKMQEDCAVGKNGEAPNTDKMQDDHTSEKNGEHQNIDKMQDEHTAEKNGEPQNIDKDLAVGKSGEPQNIEKMQEDHAVGNDGEAQNTNKVQEDHAVEENVEAQNIDKMQEDLPSTTADGSSRKSENSCKEASNEI